MERDYFARFNVSSNYERKREGSINVYSRCRSLKIMQLAVRELRIHLIFKSIIEYTIQYYDSGSLFRNLLILVINYLHDVATIIISDIIASPFVLI